MQTYIPTGRSLCQVVHFAACSTSRRLGFGSQPPPSSTCNRGLAGKVTHCLCECNRCFSLAIQKVSCSNPAMTNFSERAKHRLRIASRFLRRAGFRFEDGNFFDSVLATIQQLTAEKKDKLRSLVDWVEAYELAECEDLNGMGAPAPTKTKAKSAKRKRYAPPGAGDRHKGEVEHEEVENKTTSNAQ